MIVQTNLCYVHLWSLEGHLQNSGYKRLAMIHYDVTLCGVETTDE